MASSSSLAPQGPPAASYTAWPRDQAYVPSRAPAPPRRPRTEYGESVEVGDIPGIGQRPGDQRCLDPIGARPCDQCVVERAGQEEYEGYIMPGPPSDETPTQHWLTGMPCRSPHPFLEATAEMNTGRGCDTYGKPYDPPDRYGYLEIFKFDEDKEGYALAKGIEIDWGPETDTSEFRAGMMEMMQSETFKAYESWMKQMDPSWEFQLDDLADPRPWESVEKVDPKAWLASCVVEHPIDQHAQTVREWGSQEHQPWPAWEEEGEA